MKTITLSDDEIKHLCACVNFAITKASEKMSAKDLEPFCDLRKTFLDQVNSPDLNQKLESMIQLHEFVAIHYYVDHYEAHYTADDGNTFQEFHNATPIGALANAMDHGINRRNTSDPTSPVRTPDNSGDTNPKQLGATKDG